MKAAARRRTEPQMGVFAEARRKPTGAFFHKGHDKTMTGEKRAAGKENNAFAALRRGGAVTRLYAPATVSVSVSATVSVSVLFVFGNPWFLL